MIYKLNGESTNLAYDIDGEQLAIAYTLEVVQIPLSGDDDYDEWYSEFQHSILIARDEWKTQYRADNSVVPFILHTDQHGVLNYNNAWTRQLFAYLGLALKWNEVSACIGLGDVDMSDYADMYQVLSYLPTNKLINIWGNHDLWRSYTTVNDQFVIDWDTNYFDNSNYLVSHAYNKKGFEYHIDSAHNIKYVCFGGWEIDKNLGGYSHYNITSESMEDLITMLEVNDGYDIIILTHCSPFAHSSVYNYSTGTDTDTLYEEPVLEKSDGSLTNLVVNGIGFDDMFNARNLKTSGTILDSYGNSHSYDFSNTTGNIICCLNGHDHRDRFGYSNGILTVEYDAFAYGNNPFYMINVDRTNNVLVFWKITNDAVIQKRSIPL